MKSLLVLAAAGATASFLAACGGDQPGAPLAVERLTAAQAQPAAAAAAGTLAALADSETARRRIGYVNVAALKSLGGGIDGAELTRFVLGPGATRLDAARGPVSTAAQIGSATVLFGERRTVVGGSTELRESLSDPQPKPNLIEDETSSAVQSCLGDPAAETIVGASVLGSKSAIGVSLLANDDAPSGPKVVVCAAPHMYRDVHRVEQRLSALFPSDGLAPERRPVIGEQEIGERGVMAAAVGLDQVDPVLVGELLSGGPRLVALGAAGPAGAPGDDHGPH